MQSPQTNNFFSSIFGPLSSQRNVLRRKNEVSQSAADENYDEDMSTGSVTRSSISSHRSFDLDAILAKEMNQLTVRERNLVLEQLHGVDEIIEETPELVSKALFSLEAELQQIPRKPAYDLACTLNIAYVTNINFRLMFLRADGFDCRKAAKRLVAFFETKNDLFGAHTLTRSLHFSDLDPKAVEALETGFCQVLPTRNRAGRLVHCNYPNYLTIEDMPAKAVMQAWLYHTMFIAESDEESQRCGVVSIVYFLGDKPKHERSDISRQMSKLPDVVPVRLTGLHLCTNDFLLRRFEKLFVAVLSKAIRVRVRIHSGSPTECSYSLMTFGVPVEYLPTDSNYQKNSAHMKWIAKQRIREGHIKRNGVFHGVDVPARYDVLLGRGKNFQEHSGNQYMRFQVESKVEEYKTGSRTEKLQMIHNIFEDIRRRRGRFLRRDKDGWFMVVEDNLATEKIAASFRTFMSVARKAEREGQTSSPPQPEFIQTSDTKRSRLSVNTDAAGSNFCAVKGCV